jgi:hypothetical protein
MAQRSPTLNSAVVNFTSTGDNTVIAAPASGSICVYGITVNAATNITFKAGSTALSGAVVFSGSGSSMTLQINDEPYFYAAPGVNFIMNQSGTASVQGTVYYTVGG